MKHVVGFSGGADSQACALVVRLQYPPEDVVLMNTRAGGNESPVTDQFIADYSRHVFPVLTVTPLVRDLLDVGTKADKIVRDVIDGFERESLVVNQTRIRRAEFDPEEELTFDKLAYVKGRFPSRKAQFCTEYLKLSPQRRWLRENFDAKGIAYERYIGVRRDESQARKDVKDTECDDYFDCVLHRPIASWTKPQVFAFLAEHGEEVNPLYRMGFGRVGCAPCINSGKDDILLWASRFPEMIDKVRGWEAKNVRPFFAPMVPGREINWIDEVVEWAKTVRGGRQYALPFAQAEIEAGGCMSKWGLCE